VKLLENYTFTHAEGRDEKSVEQKRNDIFRFLLGERKETGYEAEYLGLFNDLGMVANIPGMTIAR
jgi:hypothetical protein